MGIVLDEAKNQAPGKGPAVVSTPESRVSIMVIPTNEELVIAKETRRIVEQLAK
jgi:acetate kinase